MRTYTIKCDICGEVSTLPDNSGQRPEGWGTIIYRSPAQGDIEKDTCPLCAKALERNEPLFGRTHVRECKTSVYSMTEEGQ